MPHSAIFNCSCKSCFMSIFEHAPQSVYEAVAIAARLWPDRPFLQVLPETAKVYGIDAGEITYANMLAEADRVKAQYEAAGYRAGQRVLVLLKTVPPISFTGLRLMRSASGLCRSIPICNRRTCLYGRSRGAGACGCDRETSGRLATRVKRFRNKFSCHWSGR